MAGGVVADVGRDVTVGVDVLASTNPTGVFGDVVPVDGIEIDVRMDVVVGVDADAVFDRGSQATVILAATRPTSRSETPQAGELSPYTRFPTACNPPLRILAYLL